MRKISKDSHCSGVNFTSLSTGPLTQHPSLELGHGEGVPLFCNGRTGAGEGQKPRPKGRKVFLWEDLSGQISPKPARIFLYMGKAKTVCCCLWPSTSSLPWGRIIQRRQMSPGPPKASDLPPAALGGGKTALNAQASNLNELASAFWPMHLSSI